MANVSCKTWVRWQALVRNEMCIRHQNITVDLPKERDSLEIKT